MRFSCKNDQFSKVSDGRSGLWVLFLRQALAPPAWLGRAGPLPRGRAAGHRSPAAFTLGWPSPAPLSQALTTSAPDVPSPRTGSSKAGSPWRRIQPCGNCRQACAGRGSPCRPQRDPSEGRRLLLQSLPAPCLGGPGRGVCLLGPRGGVSVRLPETGLAPAPFSRLQGSGGKLGWPPAKTWHCRPQRGWRPCS